MNNNEYVRGDQGQYLMKNHQQQIAGGNIGPQTIYGNMNNQLKGVGQKNTASASQNKFMSKSPNPQNKMMANTGYGKFKGL